MECRLIQKLTIQNSEKKRLSAVLHTPKDIKRTSI